MNKLTSFHLKIIALVTMTIDHIGVFMIPYSHPAYIYFRIIGRIAFVLFAFMIVEGVHHSRHPWKYAWRLLGFGIILDAVVFFATGDQIGNIFITLGLGALAANLINYRDARSLLAVIPLFLDPLVNYFTVPLHFSLYYDYGIYGVGLIVFYNIFYPNRTFQVIGLLAWNLGFLIANQTSEVQVLSILAIPFILFYSGKKGYSASWVKWLFYFYYPLHLGILIFLNYLHIPFFDIGWISLLAILSLVFIVKTKVPLKMKNLLKAAVLTLFFSFLWIGYSLLSIQYSLPNYSYLWLAVVLISLLFATYIYTTRGAIYERIRLHFGHNVALFLLIGIDFFFCYVILGTHRISIDLWTLLSIFTLSMVATEVRLWGKDLGYLLGFVLVMIPTQLIMNSSLLVALIPDYFPSFTAIVSSNPYLLFFEFLALVFILYLIRWGQRKPLQWLKDVPLAHRGFHNDSAPENSLDAFNLAIMNQYAIELDVQLTLDGHLVVFHDDHLQRMCGDPRRINQVALKELKTLRLAKTDAVIPTFQEVLELVHGQVPLIVEIKNQGKRRNDEICIKTSQLLIKYHGAFVVQSFNPFIVMWFAENTPQFARGQLSFHYRDTEYSKLQQTLLHYLVFNFFSRPDFINMDQHSYYPLLKWIRMRIPVISWTARTPEEYERAMKLYDNVIFEKIHPLEKKN